MNRVPSEQVNAAFEMGKLEARVSINDTTLTPFDFTKYLRNAEKAEMMADNNVLKFITDSGMIDDKAGLPAGSRLLRKTYNKYKSKYWKK